MKEYNIIEAVEYLKNHNEAKFVRKDTNEIHLTTKNGCIKCKYPDGEAFGIYDFESKWTLVTPQRTHAEIMDRNHWFKIDGDWSQVTSYRPETKYCYYILPNSWYSYSKESFNDFEMKTTQEIQEMA